MATSARILCVNEPLCFLTKKFDRYGIKQIKSLLFHFYTSDVLVNAKDVLMNAIISQKIELPKTIARKPRDSKESPDAKIGLDIDDIIALIIFLDEKKILDQMPVFVAADPDMIPSLRIQEGDMLVVLNKLASIEEHCAVLQRELHAMRSLVARGPPPTRSVAIIKNANK